ncbi:MAG: sigma-70 family RNA polymerase sigma factor [Pirellulaceae bacterium]|nr:sigma-70 family RNA polymerase sigma factor [Planctomycetales bacterium]MCA9265377.1 sigma-70 family RNA polymerase sigma factor [Planctomycetales bacterium]
MGHSNEMSVDEYLDALFREHEGVLRSQIRVRKDRSLQRRFDSSDVLQETRLTAFRRFREFVERRPMPFVEWLEQTARQVLIDLRRHHFGAEKRSVSRERCGGDSNTSWEFPEVAHDDRRPEAAVELDECCEILDIALARLSVDHQEVLRLRYIEGHSNRDIAELLGISSDAASKRHGAAIRQLRQCLRGKFTDGEL